MEGAMTTLSLHEACYQGRLAEVRALLDAGADPNAPAAPSGREWFSSAGPRPRPLNCVAIAWAMTEEHIAIARLLIERGAIVDDSVMRDHTVEMVGGELDQVLWALFEAARL
jgi:ankyrin repeat protein